MKTRTYAMLITFALLFGLPVTALAAETSSPHPYSSLSTSRQTLTQSQKAAITAARVAFATAKKNALDGFDRAIADAQAFRDQAIADSGKDQSSIQLARKNYKASYKTILNAYRVDLRIAKLNFLAALASVKGANVNH